MDLILQLIILLGCIFLGVRLGGAAIGFTGGLGVLLLGFICGVKPGSIPWDVILIIAAVISAIATMQAAGGLDYMVSIAERILRKNPKHINFLAPFVTYMLTILAGTGHTAFSVIPVIVEVAKSKNIRPCVPLSLAVVSSQIAITASPVSAAVIYMSGVMEKFGISYPMLLLICISSTLLGVFVCSLIVGLIAKTDLLKDSEYLKRLEAGLIKKVENNQDKKTFTKEAKLSVLVFILGVLFVVLYASAISKNIGLIKDVIVSRDAAIMGIMLTVAGINTMLCKIDISKIPELSTFKSGMVACICVFGVAWLGSSFVDAHKEEIGVFANNMVSSYPFLLSVAFFFASMLLYSQAATAKALVPTIIVALGMGSIGDGGAIIASSEGVQKAYIILASFPAVSALFVLPTYPTLLGAVQMDDTGSTKIGRFVFNHSFFLPGVLAITLCVAFGFVISKALI